MEGKNNVGAVGNEQLGADIDAGGFESFDFLHEGSGVDDDAIADDGLNAGAEDAAGDELEDEFF